MFSVFSRNSSLSKFSKSKNNSDIFFAVKPSATVTFTGLKPNSPLVNLLNKEKIETGSLNKYFPYFIFLDLLKTLAYKAKAYLFLTNPSFLSLPEISAKPVPFSITIVSPDGKSFGADRKKYPEKPAKTKKIIAAINIFAFEIIIF